MFDTYVTIVGNVLTAPQWRLTTNTQAMVTNFKVASTARRLDRENGRWVDGNSLRVRVNCWRRLAEGVAASVHVGDPIIVVGRLYTRDWTDSEGNHRALYEMEAVAVGHDLSRGRGEFFRNRPTLATSTVEDAEADARVRGEPTEPVPDDQVPVRLGDYYGDPEPGFADAPVPARSGTDELTMLRGGGFDPGLGPDAGGDEPDPLDAMIDAEAPGEDPGQDDPVGEGLAGGLGALGPDSDGGAVEAGLGRGRSRRRSRETVPA